MNDRNLNVAIVQQGVWDMPSESMPLAAGYLKATIDGDPDLAARTAVTIFNFRGGVSNGEIAERLLAGTIPDIVAFSVMGWNLAAFGTVAEAFKAARPDGHVVFGGVHVSGQADRVMKIYPCVDIIVNGEGEFAFRDVVAAVADAGPMGSIAGISFRDGDGIVTTPERPRIEDLDSVPSPILSGSLDLVDSRGQFRYDVALMETSRGCPYKCSFCFWGGATGQRMRRFSRSRLRVELERLAALRVHTVVLCDSNFGMAPADLDFVEDVIAVRERFGFPRALETSWAKNKSALFYKIVRRMADAGLHSSFTLALQSLDGSALDSMHRRNMRLNEWTELAAWLAAEGLDCYAELIWSAPGETVASFMEGYDALAEHVSRIAVYPMMLLPNTEMSEQRDVHGIVALRGTNDDFEYVLTHRTMSLQANIAMQQFLFWARVLAENVVLRHAWMPLRALGHMTQSEVIQNWTDWLATTTNPLANPLREASEGAPWRGGERYGIALAYLLGTDEGARTLIGWWDESMRSRVGPAEPFLREVLELDVVTRPYVAPDGVDLAGQQADHWVRRGVRFSYNVVACLGDLRSRGAADLSRSETRYDVRYLDGAKDAISSTNHEEIVHFIGTVLPSGAARGRLIPV